MNFKYRWYEELKTCSYPSADERTILSHSKLDGVLHSCIAPGCKFAHDPETADADFQDLLDKVKEFEADTTKAGKSRYSKFRMAHAHAHLNIQPGPYGAPFLKHDLNTRQILDPLHYAKLGLAKSVPWKHGSY